MGYLSAKNSLPVSMNMLVVLAVLLSALQLTSALSATKATDEGLSRPQYQRLPHLREQALIQNAWTEQRSASIPKLLQRYQVDAWLVSGLVAVFSAGGDLRGADKRQISQREYAEDTVFWSLKMAEQFSARRRTTTLYLVNPTNGTSHSYTWIDNTPSLWTQLLDVLELQNPSTIAVNAHAEIAFSAGLHAGELEEIGKRLGPIWQKRLVVEPMLAVEFVATMPIGRLPWYRRLQESTWALISEAFSEDVIVPGQTTTKDVEWWIREKIQQQNYSTWFMPTIDIVGSSDSVAMELDNVIHYGDILHVDVGVTAMGMNTDTQHLAYVLPPGGSSDDIPPGILEGLKKANRMQDIVKSNMKAGLTGDEVLRSCLKQMHQERLKGKIYSHPIGDWGHAAGALIGMTNLQENVPVFGEMPLLRNTFYSIELYAEHFVQELNATLHFALEEDVYWVNDAVGWDWVLARQDRFHVIKSRPEDQDMAYEDLR